MPELKIELPSSIHGRLPVLDELKGLAILLVVLYHAGGVLVWQNLLHGDLGVDIFVILSGIGLTLSARTATEPTVTFMRRRLVRIMPAYWIALGVGVIDIKVNHIETADEVAARIEAVEKKVGPGRVKWVHPDCGFWMLKRSIADRKMEALVRGRDKYLGL